jgi:hypothetical protein
LIHAIAKEATTKLAAVASLNPVENPDVWSSDLKIPKKSELLSNSYACFILSLDRALFGSYRVNMTDSIASLICPTLLEISLYSLIPRSLASVWPLILR